jgi:hypothetical protein
VSLPDEQVAAIKHAVASGRARRVSSFISEAVERAQKGQPCRCARGPGPGTGRTCAARKYDSVVDLQRSVACPAGAADRSTGGRSRAGASTPRCPASPADAFAAPSAAPCPTPTRPHDRPTTTVAAQPDGEGRRPHDAAQGSPTPSRHRYEPSGIASRPPGRRSNTSSAAPRPSRMPDPSHPFDQLPSRQVTTPQPSIGTLQPWEHECDDRGAGHGAVAESYPGRRTSAVAAAAMAWPPASRQVSRPGADRTGSRADAARRHP